MKVGFYATLRKIVGAKYVDVGDIVGMTVAELVHHVVALHPALAEEMLDADGGISRHVHVFIDGRSANWLADGKATRIEPTHQVEFFPAVAGG